MEGTSVHALCNCYLCSQDSRLKQRKNQVWWANLQLCCSSNGNCGSASSGSANGRPAPSLRAGQVAGATHRTPRTRRTRRLRPSNVHTPLRAVRSRLRDINCQHADLYSRARLSFSPKRRNVHAESVSRRGSSPSVNRAIAHMSEAMQGL